MKTVSGEVGEAWRYLNRAFGLPATGDEQDWDLELSNKDRIEEFMVFYETKSLSKVQKQELMKLIISSLDDLAWDGDIPVIFWIQFIGLALRDKSLHQESLNYWACWRAAGPESEFKISPLIRETLNKC